MAMPPPTSDIAERSGQTRNHSIQKSHSVGGFVISKITKKTNQHNTLQNTNLRTVQESNEDVSGEVLNPQAPNTTPLRRKKKGFGYILNWLKGDQKRQNGENNRMIHSEEKRVHKNGGNMLHVDIIRNGTNINHGLAPSRSLDSLCSVASTSSFAYVPISSYSKTDKTPSNKRISVGPSCSKETYKARMDWRRKKIVEDLNVSLVAKYKLQPADYSPPTLRKSENFSAISGPSLPSGPHLPTVDARNEDEEEDNWSEASSTLSFEDTSKNYSAASNRVQNPVISKAPTKKVVSLIKPKERKGQILQALTLPSGMKNALEDIGHIAGSEKAQIPKSHSSNPFEETDEESKNHDEPVNDMAAEINDKTLKNSPKARDRIMFIDTDYERTIKRSIEAQQQDLDETLSTAPTMALGWESDRLAEVKPYAHIPGKRKAPEPPQATGPEIQGAAALDTTKPDKMPAKFEQPLQKVSKMVLTEQPSVMVAELKIIQKIDAEMPQEEPKPQGDILMNGVSKDKEIYADRYEPVEVYSPKPWYKKKPFIFDMVGKGNKNEHTTDQKLETDNPQLQISSPSAAQKNVKQAKKAKTVIYSSPPVRPVSLLASISDFDRLAAEIVSQRQKEQKLLMKANDEAFYLNNNDAEESQVAIDAIMDQVEKKLDCLDAIEKHNQRWETQLSKLDQDAKPKPDINRNHSPTTDMHNLVSDLNSFLNTTQKEIHTPKSIKKKWGASGNKDENNQSPMTNGFIPGNGNGNKKKVEDSSSKFPFAKQGVSSAKNIVLQKPEKWSCSKCTLINPGHIRICTVCGASRKDDADKDEVPATIFDVPEIEPTLETEEEQMPQKGNVLDKVVQFTALQMFAREAPVVKSSVTPGVAKTSIAGLETKSYLGAVPKQILVPEDVSPEPTSPTKFKDDPGSKYFENERLEKEERAAILAQWKREHDERAKARRDYFQMAAVRQREDVIVQQTRLLEEANRKLDQKLKTEQTKKDHHQEKREEPGSFKDVKEKEIKQIQTKSRVEHTTSNLPKDKSPKTENRNFRFDATKTPSYFISKTPVETSSSPQTSSESSDDHEPPDAERLRQKRLAFFQRNVIESAVVAPTTKMIMETEPTMRETSEAKVISNSTLEKNDDRSLSRDRPDQMQRRNEIENSRTWDNSSSRIVAEPFREKDDSKARNHFDASQPKTNDKKFQRDFDHFPERHVIPKSPTEKCDKNENKFERIDNSKPSSVHQETNSRSKPSFSKADNLLKLDPSLQSNKINSKQFDKGMENKDLSEKHLPTTITKKEAASNLKTDKDESHYKSPRDLLIKGRNPNYDYPKFPPRPVSPDYFKRKGLPDPRSYPKDSKVNSSVKTKETFISKKVEEVSSDEESTISVSINENKNTSFKANAAATGKPSLSIATTSNNVLQPPNLLMRIQTEKPKQLMSYTEHENTNIIMFESSKKSTPKNVVVSNPPREVSKTVPQTIEKIPIQPKKSDSPDTYEHIYCEIDPTPQTQEKQKKGNMDNEISYINSENKIMEIQPLKVTKQKVEQPVRPTRVKVLKKATSLDSDDSRMNTPIVQILDRAPPVTRPAATPLQRLRSISGDQGCQSERKNLSILQENGKEKRRSFHQYPSDLPSENKLSKYIPPPLPEKPNQTNFSNKPTKTTLDKKVEPLNLRVPDKNNDNSSTNKKVISSFETNGVRNENRPELLPEKGPKPFNHNNLNDKSRENLSSNKNALENFDNLRMRREPEKQHSVENRMKTTENRRHNLQTGSDSKDTTSESTNKRRSGTFDLETGSKTPGLIMKSFAIDNLRSKPNNMKNETGLVERPKHSKLTKSEEKYIADLLNAKMGNAMKDKPKERLAETKTKIPEPIPLDEERKKGAIRKRPTIQDSGSPQRPPSSFIMDDVLYTTRPLPDDDHEVVHRYNPETFVAFQLIPSDDFVPNHVTKSVAKPSRSQPDIISKEDVELLKQKKSAQYKESSKTDNVKLIPSKNEPEPTTQDPLGVMDRLDKAIAEGKLKEAAQLAKEVSKSEISAKLNNQTQKKVSKSDQISLKMFVEDKTSHNGPIPVLVRPSMSVLDLKVLIQNQFEIPVGVQRWILDKTLADNDISTLSSLGINQSDQKIFLYLVAPEAKSESTSLSPSTPDGATATQSFTLPFGNTPLPPELQQRKGRYWNYEKNRWSFCSDDSDDESKPKSTIPKVESPNPVKVKQDLSAAAMIMMNDNDNQNKLPDPKPVNTKDMIITKLPELTVNTTKEIFKIPEITPLPNLLVPKEPIQATPVVVVGKTQQVDPRDGWVCPSCTLLNIPTRPGCEACTTSRPDDYVVPPPGPLDTLPRSVTTAPVFNIKPVKLQVEAKPDSLTPYKKLDDLDLIPNQEPFECVICFMEIEPGNGVLLRECLHTFCKECLSGVIEHSETSTVGCPYKDENYSCDMTILEREIKALVTPAVLEKHQSKSLKEAQTNSKNSFLCKTPDCKGWCFISDNINVFKCPLCKKENCITCQAIHEGQDCKQYQLSLLDEGQDENSIKTRTWIEGLIASGDALKCPSCQVILLKKWGCDWVRCTYCKTEICWITRQLRWGPKGKGDTSGGCRCMADGRTKCHKLCNYCH